MVPRPRHQKGPSNRGLSGIADPSARCARCAVMKVKDGAYTTTLRERVSRVSAVADLLLNHRNPCATVMWRSHFSYICFMRAHLR